MGTKKKRKIAVLGCGWLGLPLAKKLHSNGHTVKGSTTTKEKLLRLESNGIDPFLIHCAEENCDGIGPFLNEIECLVLALPPGLRRNPNRRFDLVIEHLADKIQQTTIQQLIFISSTSVYGNVVGDIDETTRPTPISISGKQLLKCEEILLNLSSVKTTVLRFGGLVGSDRHPIHALAKNDFIENPEGKINLIHLEDCIECIVSIVEKENDGGVFNAVCPYHPSRKTYYATIAKEAGIELPPFLQSTTQNRRIISEKIQKVFDIKFNVENLLTLN